MNWQEEVEAITDAAHAAGIDPNLPMAIRRAERGAPGKDFGIRSVPAPTYYDQLAICITTIMHALRVYPQNPFQTIHDTEGEPRMIYSTNFLLALSLRYAPPNADNDPHALNENWLRNVEAIYQDLARLGPLNPKWTPLFP